MATTPTTTTTTTTPAATPAASDTASKYIHKDVQLVCVDCNTVFSWTISEQLNYEQRGFTQPKRCPSCRRERRARKQRDSEWR